MHSIVCVPQAVCTLLCMPADELRQHAFPERHLLGDAEAAFNSDCAATFSRPRLLPSRAMSLRPPFQLVPMPRGSLDGLKPIRAGERTPAPGQTLVEVAAVGLNFRDVLNVLNMYPGDPGPPGGYRPSRCCGASVS